MSSVTGHACICRSFDPVIPSAQRRYPEQQPEPATDEAKMGVVIAGEGKGLLSRVNAVRRGNPAIHGLAIAAQAG
ncbi:MAG TPA: hypothetical protein VG890_06140 [Puia sp.]|nr:hypothetical protein [Puia sp.]